MTVQMTEHPLLENAPPHTLRSRLSDAFEFGMFHLLRLLPIDVASDIGSVLARRNIRKNLPHVIEQGRANLKRLKPEWDDATIEQTLFSFQDNVGRLMAEFATLHRLIDAGRIFVDEASSQHLASVGERPTLLIGLHLGNWEILFPYHDAKGIKVTTFAVPPDTWARRVLASRVRTSFGVTILPPDRRGLHRGHQALKRGGPVLIFCDEARNGITMAPLFGRTAHRKGNLAIAAWLMRQTSCHAMVVHCRRTRKSHLELQASAPFTLQPTEVPFKEHVLQDVTFLNDKIEPIIRENLDQWYFLDDKIEEI